MTALLQNPNATLPTLVADGKAYKNTKEVVHNLIAHAPKKGVAPATAFTDKVHEDNIDPNAPLLLAVRTCVVSDLSPGRC